MHGIVYLRDTAPCLFCRPRLRCSVAIVRTCAEDVWEQCEEPFLLKSLTACGQSERSLLYRRCIDGNAVFQKLWPIVPFRFVHSFPQSW